MRGAMVEAYRQGFNQGVADRGWPLIRGSGIIGKPYRLEDNTLALFRMLCWFGLSSLQEWPEAVLAQLCAKKARKKSCLRCCSAMRCSRVS